MAEDWTGLTTPSKKLVKSYKVVYTPDALPQPVWPPSPPPSRPSTGSSGGFSGGTGSSAFGVAKESNPIRPAKTTFIPAGQTVVISGVTYKAGNKGAYVYLYFSETGGFSIVFYQL